MKNWEKTWRLKIFLGKSRGQRQCKECGKKTIWHPTMYLDLDTNLKHIVWWCNICKDTYDEEIGPFVRN